MATDIMATAAEELEETGTHTEGIAEGDGQDGEGDQGTPTDGDAAADEGGADDAGDGFALAQPYPVPSEAAFKGMDFLLDAGLATIARDLIDRHADDFWYLRGASIEWAWKRRGGGMNGKVQHHGHQRSSPHAVAHGAKEFVVWIAADASRGTAVTVDLLEAMLGHEFCHFRKNDDGELKITGHSFEGFPLEVRLFGLWQHELQNAARAFLGRSGEIEDEDAGDEESFLDALAMHDGEDEPDFSEPADHGIEDTPAYHPAQDAEDLAELAATLDAHPEEIEPLIAAAGPGPNVVTETAKRARTRRGRSAAAVEAG